MCSFLFGVTQGGIQMYYWKKSRTVKSILVAVLAFIFIAGTALSVFSASEAIDPSHIVTMYAADMVDVDPTDPNDLMAPRSYSGALWDYFPSTQASGTGVFNTYLAMKPPGGSSIERGFNSGGKVADFDEDDSKTSALPLTAVPLVQIDGVWYREFAADINEVSGIDDEDIGASPQLLSLEVLQIWQTESDNLEGQYNMAPDFEFDSAEPDLIYDLDGGFRDFPVRNYTIVLDYGINTGSGKPDYKVFVPNEWFNDKPYVVMVVVHGNLGEDPDWSGTGASDGFEEWGVRIVDQASKSGFKWHDLDADGIWDAGEPPLSGWTIYVDYDDNGVLDDGEPSAVTSADGSYLIEGINTGSWKVREVLQTNWYCSFPALGYHEETFEGGMTYTNNNFGNYQYATKTGMKFHDLDADGMKDAGEPSIASWPIYLYEGTTTPTIQVAATVTDASGNYSFNNLMPGKNYFVVEDIPLGWFQSYPNAGTTGAVYAASYGYAWGPINLDSGEVDSGNNFGNWQYASKSGMKFEDLDADGVKDAGEPGLAGWTIYVDYDNDGVLDAGEPSAVTGEGGAYTISGIVPGTWRVKEVAQAGWTQSYPADPDYHEEIFTTEQP